MRHNLSIKIILCFLFPSLAIATSEEKDESQIAGAPSELQVHPGHDSVQVSWLPPLDNNVVIRGYQIGWGINIPDIEKANVESNVRQYTIRGLKPNREYVISLRAFNKIGQGFPIYETVKTYSYGKVPTENPIATLNDDDLLVPVALRAETLSSSEINLYWVDPNEKSFNQYYTVKYGISDGTNEQHKMLNTSETEHLFEGLKPDSQYEFTVKLANSQMWSLTTTNRTFPSPPSSPPRDLTIVGPQSARDDPNLITLNWQPPKYANGEIREYILLYTDDLHSPEREWMMATVKGDKLSIIIRELNPGTTFYFKLQARNVKGYGPFSPINSFTTPSAVRTHNLLDNNLNLASNGTIYDQIVELLSMNITNILLGAVTLILLVLVIAVIVACTEKCTCNERKRQRKEQKKYIKGRKQSNGTAGNDDLWIQQNGGRYAALVNTSAQMGGGIVYEDFDLASTLNDGQRILLVDRQQRAFIASGTPGPPLTNSPIPRLQTHYASTPYQGTLSRGCQNSMLASPFDHFHHQSHNQQQSHLTPATPRNPQIIYARADRQPIAKVDFGDIEHAPPSLEDRSGSFAEIREFGGANNQDNSQPSPQPTQKERPTSSGYQAGPIPASMRSFSAVGRGNGKISAESQQKVAHVVRPIICANAPNSSPSANRNGMNNQQAQKTPPMICQRFTTATNKVPVGRAMAQPRVNIAAAAANPPSDTSSASPYSSVRVQRESLDLDANLTEVNGGLGHNNHYQMKANGGSTEELNVQEIDQMIDTLQQLQHEFTSIREA